MYRAVTPPDEAGAEALRGLGHGPLVQQRYRAPEALGEDEAKRDARANREHLEQIRLGKSVRAIEHQEKMMN